MSFSSIHVRTIRIMLTRPTLWLYGMTLALLGWTSLPVALFAAATRSSANPIGGSELGALALAAILLVRINRRKARTFGKNKASL